MPRLLRFQRRIKVPSLLNHLEPPEKPARPVARRLVGYAAFDSSPPAIMFVAEPARMIGAPQRNLESKATALITGLQN